MRRAAITALLLVLGVAEAPAPIYGNFGSLESHIHQSDHIVVAQVVLTPREIVDRLGGPMPNLWGNPHLDHAVRVLECLAGDLEAGWSGAICIRWLDSDLPRSLRDTGLYSMDRAAEDRRFVMFLQRWPHPRPAGRDLQSAELLTLNARLSTFPLAPGYEIPDFAGLSVEQRVVEMALGSAKCWSTEAERTAAAWIHAQLAGLVSPKEMQAFTRFPSQAASVTARG